VPIRSRKGSSVQPQGKFIRQRDLKPDIWPPHHGTAVVRQMWDDFPGHSCGLTGCEEDRQRGKLQWFSELGIMYLTPELQALIFLLAETGSKLPTGKAILSVGDKSLQSKSPDRLPGAFCWAAIGKVMPVPRFQSRSLRSECRQSVPAGLDGRQIHPATSRSENGVYSAESLPSPSGSPEPQCVPTSRAASPVLGLKDVGLAPSSHCPLKPKAGRNGYPFNLLCLYAFWSRRP
jgi:hypothetical protein